MHISLECGRSASAAGAPSQSPRGAGQLGEIVEEPLATAGEEEMMYVAVGKEVKEGKANLLWAVENASEDERVVLLHVHRPAQRIPTALGWLPASQLKRQEVAAYRRQERQNLDSSLDEYISMCSRVRKVEKLVFEKDVDVGKGIVEAISSHGITKLVMGAAADKNYTRKMKAPKSKTALTVQQQADPSCKIIFLCKGYEICTRDASLNESAVKKPPVASPSSISSTHEFLRSKSAPGAQGEQPNLKYHTPGTQNSNERSFSADFTVRQEFRMATSPTQEVARSSTSGSRGSSTVDPWDAASRTSDHSLFDELNQNTISLSMPKDAEREFIQLLRGPEEDNQSQSPEYDLAGLGVNDVLYRRLQGALIEEENSRLEANEEVYKRQKAEHDLNEAMRKVKIVETVHTKEVSQRKEAEEVLRKERMEVLCLERERDEVYEELQQARQRMAAMEIHISYSDQILKDNERKLSRAYCRIKSMRQEYEELRWERDTAVRENEELLEVQPRKEEATTSILGAEKFSEFSLSELEQATQNFHKESKIGEGGYGCVYKGFLRHTTVAIKKLNPEGMQGKAEFQKEMDVLSKVRHPNLVTLIGACPEAWALVYEFLPNGSLEDRLTCKDNSPPLNWKVRTRIAAEICSALIFLHSCKPLSVVHGDLKPANILLDANLVSKLGDFGICHLLIQSSSSTTLFHCTYQPKGTFAYMDPELLSTGEITTKSDVYSFGVILLRLLTGKPAVGVSKVVQEALDKKCLDKILDPSAGDWPYVQAERLAILGLKCCKINRKSRPDATTVWRTLKPLTKTFAGSPSSFRFAPEDASHIPPYFVCPMSKELMNDPQIAADGFTYEAEAIKGWIDSGRDTSPTTNLKLSHHELIPNHALRSAIQGWLQDQI